MSTTAFHPSDGRRPSTFGRIDWDGHSVIISARTKTKNPVKAGVTVAVPTYQPITVRVRPDPPFDPNAPANLLVTISSVHIGGPFNKQVNTPAATRSERLPWPSGTFTEVVTRDIEAPIDPRNLTVDIWVEIGDEVHETIKTTVMNLTFDWKPGQPVIIEVIVSWMNGAWYPKSAKVVAK